MTDKKTKLQEAMNVASSKVQECQKEITKYQNEVFKYRKKLIKLHNLELDIPEGKVIVWKVCWNSTNWNKDHLSSVVLVKLEVPEKAERWSGKLMEYILAKRKVSEAKVLGIYSLGGRLLKLKVALSSYDTTFKYVVGKKVKPKLGYAKSPSVNCTSGIHVFKNKKDAVAYAEYL